MPSSSVEVCTSQQEFSKAWISPRSPPDISCVRRVNAAPSSAARSHAAVGKGAAQPRDLAAASAWEARTSALMSWPPCQTGPMKLHCRDDAAYSVRKACPSPPPTQPVRLGERGRGAPRAFGLAAAHPLPVRVVVGVHRAGHRPWRRARRQRLALHLRGGRDPVAGRQHVLDEALQLELLHDGAERGGGRGAAGDERRAEQQQREGRARHRGPGGELR